MSQGIAQTPVGTPRITHTGAGTADSGMNLTTTDEGNSSIQVFVRVRPFSKRESEEDTSTPVVEVTDDARNILLYDPSSPDVERGAFAFDYCISPFKSGVQFDGESSDEDEEDLAEVQQEEVYSLAGAPILQASWAGYNGCVFAYGQTSSGKTYSMMGTKRDPGVIPRLCRQLFERLEEQMESEKNAGKKVRTAVQVTYMEIYNEQVKDLLRPKPKPENQQRYKSRFDAHALDEYQNLKVRQHPIHGPFVEGITRVDVKSWLECVQLIRTGNELRSQANTEMNDSSSRSHAIFQIMVTHTEAMGAKVRGKVVTNNKVSKLNLVDLAGSERLLRSGVTGKHLTEATHINQSLSTLRKVVDALITNSKAAKTGGKKTVIPYRESLLTWILADNFGGNSKTIMVATVSPAPSSWQETESTLRYASLARGIINRVRVNEDPSTKLIRELQAQLKTLQEEIIQVRSGTLTAMDGEARTAVQAERVRELEEYVEMNCKAMEELQQREDCLRREMTEFKEREQKLLKQHEELKKGESYWRNKAQQLEGESAKLKEELRQVQKGGDDAGGKKFSPSHTLAGDSLLASKGDKSMFWLDENSPIIEEAAKQTSLLKKKRQNVKEGTDGTKRTFSEVPEQTLTKPAPPLVAPAPIAASIELSAVEDPSWTHADAWAQRKDLGPEKGLGVVPPRTRTPPNPSGRRGSDPTIGSQPQVSNNQIRPVSDGPLGPSPKYGRRAEEATPEKQKSTEPTHSLPCVEGAKHGRRANNIITSPEISPMPSPQVDLGRSGLTALRTELPRVTMEEISLRSSKSDPPKPWQVKVKPPSGADALDTFLSQPAVSSSNVRTAK